MSEPLPPSPQDAVRLMTGAEAIAIMQRAFNRMQCPVQIKPNMTMGSVLQLLEHWLNNVEARDRALSAAKQGIIVPHSDASTT